MSSQSLRRCAIAVASMCVVIGGSAVAKQTTTYAGETEEGIRVKLTVAGAGNATVFRIASTEADCKSGHLRTASATFKKFDVSDPGAFADKRKSKTKDGRYLLRDTFLTTGEVASNGASWTGTYDKTTKVIKDGRGVDTCVLSTTWEVS